MATGAHPVVDLARRAFVQQAWDDAFRGLQDADAQHRLEPPDLERLVWSAGMLDRDPDLLGAMERLYQSHLDAGQTHRAAYWAFFHGFRLFALNEPARANGWLQRARHLADSLDADCAVHGYLLLPGIHKSLKGGDLAGAEKQAAEAVAIGARCNDPDLVALARCQLGRAIARQGGVDRGVAQLDEAMVAATTRELTPVVTGLVYCSVIATCQQVFAFDRAREWTSALAQWCEAQPQLVQFNGQCRIHRAEIMALNGAWPEAIEEARQAAQRAARAIEHETRAAAAYQEGEIHRLRGEFEAAEDAYKTASQWGQEPQPGLALLRLTQGRSPQAVAAIRRCLAALDDALARARLLPAAVEIFIAADLLDEARRAHQELAATAGRFGTPLLEGMAADAASAVELAGGDPSAALVHARMALAQWQRLDAPYLAARLRVRAALACRALHDEEAARLEFDAAHSVFEQLGAAPDLERATALRAAPPARAHPLLTAREIEVLRLVAAGRTNRQIAQALSLAEKTIDRHLSNIFDKLDVSSRAAATAYAVRNDIL